MSKAGFGEVWAAGGELAAPPASPLLLHTPCIGTPLALEHPLHGTPLALEHYLHWNTPYMEHPLHGTLITWNTPCIGTPLTWSTPLHLTLAHHPGFDRSSNQTKNMFDCPS